MTSTPPSFPGSQRLIELYHQNLSIKEIAADPELGRTLLRDRDTEKARYAKTYRTVQQLLELGVLPPRTVLQGLKYGTQAPALQQAHVVQPTPHTHDLGTTTTTLAGETLREAPDPAAYGLPGGKSQVDVLIEAWERQIGHYRRFERKLKGDGGGQRRYVVASDFHVGDERQDLIAALCSIHQGEDLIIGGDFFDFADLSRFPPNGWNDARLSTVMSRGAAALDLFVRNFNSVTLLLGNHDHRAWRKSLQNLSTEYGQFTHDCFIYMLEHKFGVQVVEQKLEKANGDVLEGIHYYHQVGDAIISHTEHCGKSPGKGAEGAYEYFRDWQDILGLQPFRVILQAHTHKQSYHRSRNNKCHLFEIGCMCDWANYAVQGVQKYGPPQHGYYWLVQNDGVTDLNESRLVCAD